MIEPTPSDPNWPRYSAHPFPRYRFLPGHGPHPRRDPNGHSHGIPEPQAPLLPPEQWEDSDLYLYGIDLYNFCYWWECHEVFESFWKAVGRTTEQGRFFQGLIQVAAAHLKRHLGQTESAWRLAQRGQEKLSTTPQGYMGLDTQNFLGDVRRWSKDLGQRPPLIHLATTSQHQDGPIQSGVRRCTARG